MENPNEAPKLVDLVIDTRTGQIRELPPGGFKELRKTDAFNAQYMEVLMERPDARCHSCYGRGHRGRDTVHNRYIPCKCVLKKRPKSLSRMKPLVAKPFSSEVASKKISKDAEQAQTPSLKPLAAKW